MIDKLQRKFCIVFQAGDIKLQIQIERKRDNTIDNALRYILLHEMGHIISKYNGDNAG